ncbi:flagellar assembly protein FliH [Parahaliea aestuarii]|uniref:Flagellar assembly protein FliH n=1 Tax=Parahaliea aestuarii TaxID=1852021 RepID=A0A5C9A3Y1_9GAMM|nr:flagellar assembly protein FliH [Parahaliea aestuarii]TXS94789.1 flagellar assembly protein FliH [Parahaliea aestuarii]
MSDFNTSTPALRGEWRTWRMGELARIAPDEPDLEQQKLSVKQRALAQRAEFESLRHQEIERARDEGYRQGLASGREAGHAEGLEQGRREGLDEAREASRIALEPLAELLQTFQDALQELDDRVAGELVDLALVTGRQLAGEALTASPEYILELVRQLLHEEPLLKGQPRLRLHPEDLQLVQSGLEEEFSAAGWTLQADESLQRGGCRVLCESGELDASRESRWQQIMTRVRQPGTRDGGGPAGTL